MLSYFVRAFGIVSVAGKLERVFTWTSIPTYDQAEEFVRKRGQQSEASPTVFMVPHALAALRRDLEQWNAIVARLVGKEIKSEHGWPLTAEDAQKLVSKTAEILALAEKEAALIKPWRDTNDKYCRPLGPSKQGTENHAPVGTRVHVRFDKMNKKWTDNFLGVVADVDEDMRFVALDELHGDDERIPKPIRGRSEIWAYYDLVHPLW